MATEQVAATLARLHARAEQQEEMVPRSLEMIARSELLLKIEVPKVWPSGRSERQLAR